MATILDKDITRESTIKVNKREVQVTLCADQSISLKLKGMKTGVLSIGIDQLYNQLAGVETEVKDEVEVKVKPKKQKPTDEPMISLYRLRSLAMANKMDYDVRVELEKVLCELIGDENYRLG